MSENFGDDAQMRRQRRAKESMTRPPGHARSLASTLVRQAQSGGREAPPPSTLPTPPSTTTPTPPCPPMSAPSPLKATICATFCTTPRHAAVTRAPDPRNSTVTCKRRHPSIHAHPDSSETLPTRPPCPLLPRPAPPPPGTA